MSYERLKIPSYDRDSQDYSFDSLADEIPFAGNAYSRKQPTIGEILGKEKRREYASVCRPYTNKVEFDTIRAWDVLEAHRDNFKRGVIELRDWLADVFSIEPPELEFRPTKDERTAGQFSGNEYKITFYYNARRSRKGNLDDLNTIAHEMWHAHQLDLADYGNDNRSRIYDRNFNCYFPSEENDELYERQLIEEEAFYFGDKIELIFRGHLNRGQDIETMRKRTFRKENLPRPNVVDGFLRFINKK